MNVPHQLAAGEKVAFSGCTANGKNLSSYSPGAWEAVTKSGQVVGIPSAISGGTSFTVTF